MTKYLYSVIALNFCVCLTLLMSTNLLRGMPPNWKRFVLAALVGGIYAGICMLYGSTLLGNRFVRLLFLAVISCIAFGWDKNGIKSGVLYIILNIALEHIALIFSTGGKRAVILCALIMTVLCLISFCGSIEKRKYADVMIRHRDKQIHMTALRDTGNMLKDPVTGLPVLVVDCRAARVLLDLNESELRDPIGTISRGKFVGIRLIPYNVVGHPSGMLLGIKADDVKINGKSARQIIAFAPHRIAPGCEYEAVIGGNV